MDNENYLLNGFEIPIHTYAPKNTSLKKYLAMGSW